VLWPRVEATSKLSAASHDLWTVDAGGNISDAERANAPTALQELLSDPFGYEAPEIDAKHRMFRGLRPQAQRGRLARALQADSDSKAVRGRPLSWDSC
jgi:hypothetical protein